MRPLLPLILALACVLPASAAPTPPATHRIPVQVVILRGSPWTWAAVERRVNRMKEVIAQCGVRIDATIVELAPPARTAEVIYDHTRSAEPNGMSTIASVLAQPKPTLFYVTSFPDNPSQGGTSRNLQSTVGLPPVPEVDTAWIPYNDPPLPDHANYSVDAHELVHVLGDMKHWTPDYHAPPGHIKGQPDPNRPESGLMVKYPHLRNDLLHPYVCERIKKFPRATAL